MQYIDSHCHIIGEDFDTDQALKHIIDEGFEHIMVICLNEKELNEALKLKEEYSFIDVAFGIHPEDIELYNQDYLEKILEILKDERISALGEIGLDYHFVDDNKELQRYWFIEQIKIANKVDKPILVHSRDAIQETYDIMKNYDLKHQGILHCFSSGIEMAKEFVKLGYYISLAGPVTFKNGKKAQIVARDLPLEYLLSETDCPYMTPEPFRGTKNEPLYVKYNYAKIADLKGINVNDVVNQFKINYANLFHK